MRPTSVGEVFLKSNSPFDAPLMNPNYLSTETDRLEAGHVLAASQNRKWSNNKISSFRDEMRKSIRLAREVFAQKAFDRFRGKELQPGQSWRHNAFSFNIDWTVILLLFLGVDVTSDEQLDEFVRNMADSAYHPCGTCKMGKTY